MKRVIQTNTYIYAMATNKRKALDRLYSYSDQIEEHIIKCVVYGDSLTTDPLHWIHEIATYLNAANIIKCKSNLTEADYLDNLFPSFGDDLVDYQSSLWDFYDKHIKRRQIAQYPEFEITDELIKKYMETCQDIIQISLPYLVNHQVLSVREWERLLLKYL